MIRARIIMLLCLIAAAVAASAVAIDEATSERNDKEEAEAQLARLDREISQRMVYLNHRHMRIDSLCREFERTKNSSVREKATRLCQLGDSYVALSNDSALWRYNDARQLLRGAGVGDDDSLMASLSLRIATYLPLAGLAGQAERLFEKIDTTGMSTARKREYFDAGRQMYSYLSTFFTHYHGLSRTYSQKSLQMQERVLGLSSPSEPSYALNRGEVLMANHQNDSARAELQKVVVSEPEVSNLFARASHHLATIARAEGDLDNFVFHMARSAISDVKSGTLEVTSIQELGEYLFKHDDPERSYRYLSVALSNAVECNAMMRVIESSRSLPIIERTHNLNSMQTNQRLTMFVWLLVLVATALVVAMVYLIREQRQESELRQSLKMANSVKEVYISQFLTLCSIYIDKLNQFCKLAHRKISAGKVDDLDKLVQSGKFIEENSREFYEVFDRAFLHIYPGFLEEVNRLLKPDQQIVLGPDEKMNNELRILAFMRLGIHESGRIAQMLNYSVNTIYTYRNRLKSKALDRETFEAQVMAIGT